MGLAFLAEFPTGIALPFWILHAYRKRGARSSLQLFAGMAPSIAILFVYGTESDFMKSVRGHRAQLFPHATIVPIEGAGHHIPHEKPVELAEIVVPFLMAD